VLRRLVLLVPLTVAGCSSGPLVRDAPDTATPADFPNHTAEQVLYQLTASAAPVASYRSEADVALVTPDGDRSAGASLRARLADSLYASLRGPLGITVGRGLATADSFFAHDVLDGRLYAGALAAAEGYVPGAGEPGALARTLLGLLVPDPAVAWEVHPEAATYVLTGPADAGGSRRYVVDPALWRVTALDEFAADGTPLTSRRFDAFDTVDGVVVPRRVVLASPPDGLSVTVEHRQLTLNPPDLVLPFRRPTDAEVVRLE
jgi:hypothetical protein